MLFTALLAAILGQSASTIAGAAMGPNKQPVGQALIYISQGPADDGSVPALGQGVTDAQGRYRLEVGKHGPGRLGRQREPAVILAYRPGMALFVTMLERPGSARDPAALQLALEPAVKRTIQLKDKAGRPLAGVQVAPVFVATNSQGLPAAVPDALADRLSATTGADGSAVLDCLEPKTGLFAVRVSIPRGATQTIALPVASSLADPVPLTLDPTGRLVGRVRTEDGKPAAGATVELWSAEPSRFGPSRVRFEGGPIRAGDDGSFRTPAGLLGGTKYRVSVSAKGWEQVGGPYVITTVAAEGETSYPDIVLRPLRSIAGRVVDRQGHAVPGASVAAAQFANTMRAASQSQGQFRVTGLVREKPVVLAARAAGFRATGRVLGEGEDKNVEIVLARVGDPSPQSMTTRPGPIAEAERHKLARQLFDPYLKKVLAEGVYADKTTALRVLTAIDPAEVVELLGQESLANQPADDRGALLFMAVKALAAKDLAQAEAVAKTITHDVYRTRALVELTRRLPDEAAKQKLALLDDAVARARAERNADMRLALLAEIAGRYADLGEQAKAKALADEVREGVSKGASPRNFQTVATIARLGRVDLPAALALAADEKIPAQLRPRILANMAPAVAASNPAEAERLLEETKTFPSRFPVAVRTCYRMAPADLPRARRIALDQADVRRRVVALISAAYGLPASQQAAAREVIRQALDVLDASDPATEDQGMYLGQLLPMIEAADPTLVPELFWRIVERPGALSEALLLARYDAEVASALFQAQALAQQVAASRKSAGRPQPPSALPVTTLAIFDPRAAAASVLSGPEVTTIARNANQARIALAELLGSPPERQFTRYSFTQEGLEAFLLSIEEIY